MCGLCGSFALDPDAPVDRAALERMARALAHRGPDAERVELGRGFGLGFRRLSILDLSERGMQPASAQDGAITSVVNGEIYNYPELRADLEAHGVQLHSGCDGEIIPHLYAQHGPAFVERLRGMFALAVVDAREHRLLLARDRLGKKPLYVARRDGRIDFASEPKALLAASDAAVRPDPAALVRFLCFGYVPGPGSAFLGFERVQPGERWVVDRGGVRVDRYWSLPEPAARENVEPRALVERFEHLLAQATTERLAADVPLGVLLSGGIDSGLVLAAAAKAARRPIEAFTIAFADRAYDESALAAQTAKHLGVRMHVLEAKPLPADALLEIARVWDEPFGDASAYPTALVARLARSHVTVALSGDGGDEAFAGYRRYRALALSERIAATTPAALRRLFARAIGEVANGSAGRGSLGTFRRFASALGLATASERQLVWSTYFRASVRERFLDADLRSAADPDAEARAEFDGAAGSVVERALRVDQARYLPDDLLVKMDTASMAVGLEVRSPLLDHRIVEFAATLPAHMRNGSGDTKPLLRALAARVLTPEVATARKRGFGVPLAAWLRGPFAGVARRVLLSERQTRRRVFAPGALRDLLERHASGREDWSQYIWLALVLELWFRRFVDRDLSLD